MATHFTHGAARAVLVTSRCDDARVVPGASGAEATENSGHCANASSADKTLAMLTAHATLPGIEVHELSNGAWLLCHARGARIGCVSGFEALAAAAGGFESAQRGVRELVRRIGGAA